MILSIIVGWFFIYLILSVSSWIVICIFDEWFEDYNPITLILFGPFVITIEILFLIIESLIAASKDFYEVLKIRLKEIKSSCNGY